MEIFDMIAKNYDTEKRIKRAEEIANKIRAYIDDNSGESRPKSAIEYGCGTGLVGLRLADCFSNLLLVDSSSAMIEQVEHKLSRLNMPHISTLCCDFLTATPPGLQADCIFSSLVLHHIADTGAILARLHETLREGGRLLIVELDKDDGSFHAKYPEFDGHNGLGQESLSELARQAGFKAISSKTFLHDVKIINGQEAPYSLFIMAAQK